jgi:PPM family protein phosphatase
MIASGAYVTHRGAVLGDNQDAICFGGVAAGCTMDAPRAAGYAGGKPWIIAVADGIGGANAGERASAEVVKELIGGTDFSLVAVKTLLAEVNLKLFGLGQRCIEFRGMGAAVAGLCWGADGLLAFNLGDCRVYRQQDDFLAQITKDDSIAQVLVEAGQVPPGSIRDKRVHSLTQCLGGQLQFVEVDPHVHEVKLRHPGRFLICSDGLSDALGLDDMEEAMKGRLTPAVGVQNLLSAALSHEAADNFSIVIADVKSGSADAEGRRTVK